MQLRHLRYFVAVAEELNFTRAAERLNTAQPSFSQQIRDLEEEIGTPLLIRNKRQVTLTDAGKVFLDESRLVLAQAQRAVVMARRAAQIGEQKFTIGFLPAAEVKIFPKMLTAMRARFPNFNLIFRSLTTLEQIEALANKEIDIGFLRPPIADPSLALETILTERLMVVIAADHPMGVHHEIDIREMVQFPFLRISPETAGGLHQVVVDYLRAAQVEPTASQDVDNVLTMMAVVGLGDGFTLLPDYVEQLLFRNVTVRPLRPPIPSVPLCMAWHKENQSPELSTFRCLVNEGLGRELK